MNTQLTPRRAAQGLAFAAALLGTPTAWSQDLGAPFNHALAYAEATTFGARRPETAPAGARPDDAAAFFHVNTQRGAQNTRRWNPGWTLRPSYGVFGTFAPDTALRFVVKQGGRTLADQRCTGNRAGGYLSVSGQCGSRETPIQAVGRFDVEVHLIDGATDADTLLRTHAIDVGTLASVGGNGARDVSQQYVNYAGQMLNSVIFRNTSQNNSGGNQLRARFVYAVPAEDNGFSQMPQLRCRVNGTPLASFGSGRPSITRDQSDDVREYRERTFLPPGSTQRTHERVHWQTFTADLPITWGGDYGHGRMDTLPTLEDNPGTWECDLRIEGQTVRGFSFTVANGDIQPHPEEAAGLSLPPGVHLLTTTIPANSPFDMRVDPASVRAGGFFGRAWATDAGRAMAAAVPATGTPAPPQNTQPDWGTETTGGFDPEARGAAAARPAGGGRRGR